MTIAFLSKAARAVQRTLSPGLCRRCVPTEFRALSRQGYRRLLPASSRVEQAHAGSLRLVRPQAKDAMDHWSLGRTSPWHWRNRPRGIFCRFGRPTPRSCAISKHGCAQG